MKLYISTSFVFCFVLISLKNGRLFPLFFGLKWLKVLSFILLTMHVTDFTSLLSVTVRKVSDTLQRIYIS